MPRKARKSTSNDLQAQIQSRVTEKAGPALDPYEFEVQDDERYGTMIQWGYVGKDGSERTKRVGVMAIAALLVAAGVTDGDLHEAVSEALSA